MSLEIKIDINDHLAKQLESIPMLLVREVTDKCVPAMIEPIMERVRILAPSSRVTGSRHRWSRKYKNNGRYQVDSGVHVGRKILRRSSGATAIVGHEFPLGNKQQFNQSPEGRRVYYWGRPAGKVYKRPYRTMQRSYDETKQAQLSAFQSRFERVVKDLPIG